MTDPRLENVLDVWLEDRQSGRNRTIAELCQECPELAAEVEQRVRVLTRFEQLAEVESRDTQSACADFETVHTASAPSDGNLPLVRPLPGPIGDFVPVRCLGEGGMGAVYLADDRKLHRQVAIKLMKPELAADPTARQRFLREGRAMAAVEHEHIMTIYAVGEERDTPFLVMPVLKGETLHARLQRTEPLPISESCRIAREIASGLTAAHAVGLVHRDIKPGNIWLEGARGKVKILDFGLARVVQNQDITQSSSVLGTPAYMSPEQGAGAAATPRSDLFSLGAVLYWMTTGKQPFAGENLMTTLSNLANREPQPPHKLNPHLPLELSTLIIALLSKDPSQRPATATAVVEALERVEAKLQATPSAPVAAVVSEAGRVQPPEPRSRLLWGGLFGAALILAAVIIITIERKDGTKSMFMISNPEQVTLETAPGDKVTISAEASSGTSKNKTPEDRGESEPAVTTAETPTPAWQPPAPIPFGESPFDKLDPATIPASERFAYQPSELVGLIGSHAQRQWGFCVGTAVSPNGKLAATLAASWSDGLVIWDLDTQKPKWTVPRNSQHGGSVVFSSDSERLFVCSEGILDVLDLTGPEPVAKQHTLVDGSGARNGALHYVEFCENGKTLVARGWTDQIVLFDFSDGTPKWTESRPINFGSQVEKIYLESGIVACKANRYYYRASDGIHLVTIQNARFGDDQRVEIPLVQRMGAFCISPDSQRLIVHEKDHVELWDLSQSPPGLLSKAADYKLVVADGYQFSPDCRWVISHQQGRQHLFRVDDRRFIPAGITSHSLGAGRPAAFSENSQRLVVGSDDGFVRFWDVAGQEPRELSPFDHSTAFAGNTWYAAPTLSHDGQELMLSRYPEKPGPLPWQLWTFGKTSPGAVGGLINQPVEAQIHALPEGRWFPAPPWNLRQAKIHERSGNGWSVTTQPFADLAETDVPALSAVSSNGRTAVLEIDKFGTRPRLQGWDLADVPRRRWEVPLETRAADLEGKELWISNSGDRFAVLKQSTDPNRYELALWRGANTMQPQSAGVIQIATQNPQYRAAFSPDGRMLAHLKNSYTHEIVLEDLRGNEPRELARMTEGLNDHYFSYLAFSPDGRFLAYTFVRGLGVIDVATRKVVWEYAQAPGVMDWVAWAPDCRHLLVHNDNKTVYVLRLTEALAAVK